MGGPKSFLGLPLGNQIEVSKANGQYQSHFRSGTLNIATSGGSPRVDSKDVVNVTLLGIECQIRQEASDEIYGVVTVFGPSGGSVSTRRFPDSNTLSTGPPGLRIVNLNLSVVVRGVIQNYTILAMMVENDSGDVDVIAQKIVDKINSTVASGIGELTGAPAESVADSESFKEGLVAGVKFLFGNILGVGDDPFHPESLGLRWENLQPNSPRPIQPPLQRDDDPRTITGWTHRITLSGRDDGNDLGQYALYFRVDSETISITAHQWEISKRQVTKTAGFPHIPSFGICGVLSNLRAVLSRIRRRSCEIGDLCEQTGTHFYRDWQVEESVYSADLQ